MPCKEMTKNLLERMGTEPQWPRAVLSADGLMRLSQADFSSLQLVHLLTGLDEQSGDESRPHAVRFQLSGYTEWVSCSAPVASVGWDWRLDVPSTRPRFICIGEPRSNLMFVDASGRDLGLSATATILRRAIHTIAWQDAVENALGARYI